MTQEHARPDLPEWARTMWGPQLAQARADAARPPREQTLEQRVRRLEDEREIEKLFLRYHAFYSAGEVESVLTCFTPDAVQINGRGTFIGHDSLRVNYEYLTSSQRMIIHYGTNLYATVDDSNPEEGLVTARFHATWITWKGASRVCGGTYINRTARVDDRWLISHQRITFNWQYDVAVTPRVLGENLPTPESPINQRNLLEPRYLLA